jgi:transcriptional regulator with XRE-family HTH domain
MTHTLATMAFPQQLTELRKAKGLTQAECAKTIGVSIPQYQRYETGKSQPTLDVIRSIAIAFNVPSDALIFEAAERGPTDDLRLQFEAVSQFDEEEKHVVKTLLESMIIKHEADKWRRTRQPEQATPATS